MSFAEETEPIAAVAIIGMAGRFPGAPTLTQFWQNLAAGVEAITRFTDEELSAAGVSPELLADPHFVRAGGVIADEDKFAADFFGFTPREAEITAPQHRLFLECAWQALEDAGYVGESYEGDVAVFAGMNFNNYLLNNIYSHPDLVAAMGIFQLSLSNAEAFLCTRTSYKLNLTGPSIAVQTACSTGLVATSLAYLSLLNYQADMALAGSVTLWSPQRTGYLYQEGGVVSPDGHTRTFDAKAQGSVGGNGVGVVLLKRLEDALADGDHIYAVIRGAAINNDGAMKVGYTAPSIDAQTEVVLAAQALADVDVESISYVEAHGTATALGDPVEIAALTRAFRESTDKKGFCGVGAVKTNVGHLDAAAGMAGLIKTTLALKNKKIPPSLNFETPNPQIDFENSPFYVNTTLRDWPANGAPRRAGVNSLGIGGTNAHVVLEEAPARPPLPAARPAYPLVLSARTETALRQAAQNLRDHLRENPDLALADVAYTLLVGRKAFPIRQAVAADTMTTAVSALGIWETAVSAPQNADVAFMFPDAGTVPVNSGRALYEQEPVFREAMNQCAAFLRGSVDVSLIEVLYPGAGQKAAAAALLAESRLAQPAAFALGYALAQVWLALGLEPQALVGQGVGEYVAACVSGVFSLEAALALVAARGQLVQDLPGGARLEVALAESECKPLLGDNLALTAVTAPTTAILCGPAAAIDALAADLTAKDIHARRLPDQPAANSPRVEPVLAELADWLALYERQPPQIPFLSNVTGTWITDEEAQDGDYWLAHLRQPQRIGENLESLAQMPDWVLLEVGAGDSVAQLARLNGAETAVATLPDPGAAAYHGLMAAWGQLWARGVALNPDALFAHEPRYRVPLPTYPFARQRYWIEQRPWDSRPGEAGAGGGPAAPERDEFTGYPDAPRNEVERLLAYTWSQLLGVPRIGVHDNFFKIGGDSLMSLQIVTKVRQAGYQMVPQMLLENQSIAALAAAIAPDLPVPARPAPQPEPAAGAEPATAVPAAAADRFADTFHSKPPVVCLQEAAGAEKRPLFLVPPANGNLFAYRRLVNHLHDETQPVYALMAMYDNIMSGTDLPAVAAQYLQVMRSVQAEGPYYVIGWSAGGPFAFEIAQQLRQAGETVALLGIIDSSIGKDSLAFMQLIQGMLQSNPRLERWYDANLLSRWLVTGMARSLLRFQRGEVLRRMQRYNRVAVLMIYVRWLEEDLEATLHVEPEMLHDLEPEAQLAWVQERAAAAGAEVEEAIWENITQWVEMTLRMSDLIDRYDPQRFPGRVSYVRAIDPVPNEPQLSRGGLRDETMGLAAVSGDIQVYRAPGNHFSMMDEPYVQVLAVKLKQVLAEARAAFAWTPEMEDDTPGSRLRWLLLLLALLATMLLVLVALQTTGVQ